MEPGHQLFVIARVGDYYRSLASVNHDTLAGMRALTQCHRLLQIFSHPRNRIPLEQELAAAEEHFSDKPPPPSEQPNMFKLPKQSPFSFITTCLTVGSFYRTDGRPAVAIHQTPFGLGFDHCDNGGGITVIDITDLDKVKYCFAFFLKPCESEELKKGTRIGLYYRPLTARQYLLTYYAEDNKFLKEPHSVATTTALARRPVIEATSLAETWPWGKWDINSKGPPSPHQQHTIVYGPRGLVEQSLDKMMKSLQKSPNEDDVTTIKREISHIPKLRKLLQDWLLGNAHLVDNSPCTVALFALVYEGETILNWSRFHSLTISSILAILQNPGFQGVHTINLSTTSASFSQKDLWSVLSTLPNLKNIYLIDPPSLAGLVGCEPFADFAFSKLNIRLDKLVSTGPFYHSLRKQLWILDNTTPSLYTPAFPVVQLLLHHDRSKIPDLGPYEFFFLGDALLSPVRFVTGLFQYMNILNSLVFCSFGSTNLEASACFATSSSSLKPTEFGEMGPLPAQMYTYGHEGYLSSSHRRFYSAMRDLQPKQWTVLLRQTCSSTFRYAFVRAKEMIPIQESDGGGGRIDPEKIDVFTMEDFLRETAPDVDVDDVQYLLDQIPLKAFEADSSVLSCFDKQDTCNLLNEFIDKARVLNLAKQRMEGINTL